MEEKQKSTGNLASAYAMGLFAVTAFGATLPVTQIGLESFSPSFLTFARALIATLLAITALAIYDRPMFSGNPIAIFVSGFFLIFGFPGLMAISMQSIPASHGGVVLGFLPLATALIARLIADETPSPAFWALSVAGTVIVTGYILYNAEPGSGKVIGYLWLVLAGMCASAGYVIFGKLSRTTPGWEIISRALIINLPLTLAGTVWAWETRMLEATPSAVTALLYLGSFSMFLAFCAWNVALARGGISRIGQLQLLQIFVTLGTAALLLGEYLDWLTLAAAVAITGIIALSRKL